MGIFRRLLSSTGGDVSTFKFTLNITSANTLFELPVTSPGGKQPNISIDWGDTTSSTLTNVSNSTRFHTYTSTGTYQVAISGYMPGFNVNNNSTYKNLYTSVDDWGTVGLEQIDFYGCINLNSLPNDGSGNADLHQGLTNVLRFNSTFRQTGITYIPVGIFDYAVNATSFNDTFVFCQGLSGNFIPSDLFDNNTQVTSFSGTFNACLNLTTIPPGLFDNNTSVVNFSSVFRNCRSITSIPSNFFTYNQSVTTFRDAFNMATTTNQLAGSTPVDLSGDEIWERTPTPVGTDCFAFCSGLSNFASIPSTFK